MTAKDIKTSTQFYTNRNDAELRSYLHDLKNSNPLTMEDEMKLGRIIQLGGKAGERALEKLVTANLRFVVSVAKLYNYNSYISIMDLVSEGNIGLIKAAQLYDPSRKVKFITFAVAYIRQAITDEIANHGGMVRLPYNNYKELHKFLHAQERSLQYGENALTVEEYCLQNDYDIALMHTLLEADREAVRTDATLRCDEDTVTTFGDMLHSYLDVDSELREESLKYDLQRAMDRLLSKEERKTLCLKYGIGCEQMFTNEDIAEAIGLKRERTRQIINNAQDKLARSASSLRYYLAA